MQILVKITFNGEKTYKAIMNNNEIIYNDICLVKVDLDGILYRKYDNYTLKFDFNNKKFYINNSSIDINVLYFLKDKKIFEVKYILYDEEIYYKLEII